MLAMQHSELSDKNVARATMTDRLKMGLDDLIDFYGTWERIINIDTRELSYKIQVNW